MRAVDLIAAKRDGRELTREELSWLLRSYQRKEVPDYQISAWLMAVYFHGMTARETADLTMAMVESGTRLDLSSLGEFVGDKHSTGGVGDKTTLVVAPLVAAAGVPVAKMSGRGLGFSGGTIDKLESIAGFRTQLGTEEFIDIARRTRLVVVAQSPDLAPADGLLYALRDVTATIESIPLIASSIMSKKIAAGATGVVLDVKIGAGAFMKTMESTRELATTMRDIGRNVGLQVRAVISGMDQPLGWAVGNALEVREAVQTLRGEGPADLLEVSTTLGAHLLHMAGKAGSVEEGVAQLSEVLASGRALAKFREFVEGQGGDPDFIDDLSLLPQAHFQAEVPATAGGYVTSIDAETIGRASVEIGAGRAVKGQSIDHAVGFVLHKKIGDIVTAGESLATVHAASEAGVEVAVRSVLSAFSIGGQRVEPLPTVLEVIQ
ncbi:MAG: pyrimidine-nucleoside phosphorylase [Chloroflexota bacterium]|nr:pyrimidine-nucleoside phosphorylase [Chloroflexota bacterium]MDQ5864124.1 pyrimidine-nucleoside phosphorylase [Chloroflexota bacterium]